MSNEKHKIDELFRQKLGNYELETPDHVWRNIEAKRTPLHKAINYFKNKRAAVTVVAMVFVACLAYMSFVQADNSATTADNSQQNSTVSAPATAGNTENTAPAMDASAPVSNPVAGNAIGSNRPAGNGGANNTGINNSGSNTAQSGTTTGNNNSNNTGNTETTTNTIETPVLTTNPPADNATPAQPVIAETPVAELTEGEPAAEQPSPEAVGEAKKQEKTTVKPERLRKWSMDVYASGDMAGRSLSANGASQQYINGRNSTESFKPGFSFGVRVNYELNTTGMLKLRTGFQYSRINEKVEFTTSENITRTQTVTGVVVDPVTGQPIGTTTRTDTIHETLTNTATAQNRFTFIDLPVQLEIGLYKNSCVNIFATGGAAINLRFAQNGGILNQQMTGIKELSGTSNPYKTNAGISLLAGLGAEFRMCGNFSLLVETQYRQGLTSVVKPGEGMNQTFRTVSVGAGLRYRF